MKINLDRLCKLAGVESKSQRLNEASNRSYHEDPSVQNTDDPEFRFGKNQLSEMMHNEMEEMMDLEGMQELHEEEAEEEAEEDLDELIEVDEAMLVQEIRRAKKMIEEAHQKKSMDKKKKAGLQEAQLRKIIAEEIDGVFKDLNLTSGWVYGKKQPTNRTRGAVNTAFPGVGFKNSK
jgi:hypothetical protein